MRKKKHLWVFISEIVLTLLICVLHAVTTAHYANYYPINGTFQNYNPVRRFMNGQIPYKDFQDYLGLGHLYTGTLFTFVFGGTYRNSLAAFSFLTIGSLALLSFVTGLAITGKKETAVTVTNIILMLMIIKSLFFPNLFAGTEGILDALNYALGSGNSARYLRGVVLPLLILLIWAGCIIIKRIEEKHNLQLKHRDIVMYAGIGLLSGFAFVWSNDYGISCWVCMIVMTLWLSICRTGKLLRSCLNTVLEISSSIVGIVTAATILTWGHFTQWVSATFGTGGYQGWYYNSIKSYYLYEVDFSCYMIIQAGICIVYMIMLYRSKGSLPSIRRYAVPGFANMVCFCAVNEYHMLSGSSSREVALAVLFLTIVFEICSYFGVQASHRKEFVTIIISIVISLVWLVSTAKDEFVFRFMTDHEGVYVEAMGGNLTTYGDDLLETEKFLDENAFFATYASAQEVVCGTFQPSGTDYIIHVLGDEQRENYLNAFDSKDFKYAATIKETLTDWEYWVQRANWFFYRNLYAEWHPVYSNSYEVYWERNTDEQNQVIEGIQLNIIDVSVTTKKLVVQTDEPINGIADAFIDYEVNKNGNRSSPLVFRKLLKVTNTGTVYAEQGADYEYNYLRDASKEYIPIPVVNGYGEVTLKTCPAKNTVLQLNEAGCDKIYTCTSDYVEVIETGMHEGENSVRIANTSRNANAVAKAAKMELQGNNYEIVSIDKTESDIYITVNSPVQYDKSLGNYMKIE